MGRTQIGGVLDWDVEVILASSIKDSETHYKMAKWRLMADGYWLFEVPERVVIKLYSDGKGYWEGKGLVTSQCRKVFDTLIHEPFEIVGEGVLEGKE